MSLCTHNDMDSETWFRLKTKLHKLRRMNRKELSKRIDIHHEHWQKHTDKVIALNQKIAELQQVLAPFTHVIMCTLPKQTQDGLL